MERRFFLEAALIHGVKISHATGGVIKLHFDAFVIFMPPFEEGGAYCVAHVGQYVGMSVGMSVALNLCN